MSIGPRLGTGAPGCSHNLPGAPGDIKLPRPISRGRGGPQQWPLPLEKSLVAMGGGARGLESERSQEGQSWPAATRSTFPWLPSDAVAWWQEMGGDSPGRGLPCFPKVQATMGEHLATVTEESAGRPRCPAHFGSCDHLQAETGAARHRFTRKLSHVVYILLPPRGPLRTLLLVNSYLLVPWAAAASGGTGAGPQVLCLGMAFCSRSQSLNAASGTKEGQVGSACSVVFPGHPQPAL